MFKLTAIEVSPPELELHPASIRRTWMDSTPEKFANRCLPMLMANQSGWYITTKNEIRATWRGQESKESLVVTGRGAMSHFGSGILTWNIPWLFRTSPGWNLLVRGPANFIKSNAHPLEGLVETDTSHATFTMNWLLDPHKEVIFSPGEPIAMLIPQHRGDLEEFEPDTVNIKNTDEYLKYREWTDSRNRFNADLLQPGSKAWERKWEKDYFRSAEHRRRDLRPFI
jgi:Family of unknown function (DUF6065)